MGKKIHKNNNELKTMLEKLQLEPVSQFLHKLNFHYKQIIMEELIIQPSIQPS